MIWFWERIRLFFIAQWVDFWNGLASGWGVIINGFISAWQTVVTDPFKDAWNSLVDFTSEFLDLEPKRLKYLKDTLDFPFPINIIVVTFMLVYMLFLRGTNWISAGSTKLQWEANQDVRPNLLSADHFAAYLFKNPDDWGKVKVFLTYLGLNEEQITVLIKSLQQIPTIQQNYALLNRGDISIEKFKNDLTKQGYSVDDADTLHKLRWFIPTISDLVLLAGRDQFEPETIEKFELQKDVPTELIQWGLKIGYDEDWIRKYWGAHWRVPSIQQAFEMVHRDVLEFDELDIYYDLADIAPFFRQRLEAIAFNVLGRVDVRRMQRLGVLTEEETFKAYQHMGYSPVDAQRMLDFTVAFNADQDKELTKGELAKLYRRGVLTAYDFREYLQTLKYSRDEAFLINELVDLDLEDKRIESFIKATEQLFKQNDITENDARAALTSQDVKTDRIENYIFDWVNDKIVERRMPTKADVIRWFKLQIISIEEFRVYFTQLGFIEGDVDNYVKQIGANVQGSLSDELIGT